MLFRSEPKGFDVITMDGFVSEATVAQTRAVLTDPARREQMVAHNFELGRQFFSFAVLEQKLKALLADIAGVS